jgi:hypothetical protein
LQISNTAHGSTSLRSASQTFLSYSAQKRLPSRSLLTDFSALNADAQGASQECRLWSKPTVSTALDSVLFKSRVYSRKFFLFNVGYFATFMGETVPCATDRSFLRSSFFANAVLQLESYIKALAGFPRPSLMIVNVQANWPEEVST